MKSKLTKEERRARTEKALKITRKTFQVITYVTSAAFIGLIIAMIVMYGIDATANEVFTNGGGYTFGIVGIPLFSVILFSGIVIAILNLRDDLLKDEEETSEFKMIQEVKQ